MIILKEVRTPLYELAAIREIEDSAVDTESALAGFRRLTFHEFGEFLLSLPNEDFPILSSLLPASTPESVQKEWTGSSGIALLRSSISFVNFLVSSFAEITGDPIGKATVLDFGCGWGRLLRLMMFYVKANALFGCDAWENSLAHCKAAGIQVPLAKSDSIPTDLPFAGMNFDLIYCFSVFTHLSETTTAAVLRCLRKRICHMISWYELIEHHGK